MNRLFEQYVYGVIEQHIDQVDAGMQAKLIRHFSQLHDQLYPEVASMPPEPLIYQPKAAFRAQQLPPIGRLLTSYRQQCRTTADHIERMDRLIEQVSVSTMPRGLFLLHHYQAIRARLVISLKRTQLMCQHRLFKLVIDPT